MGIAGIKHVLLVLSGKGGVGKSSVSVHLALSLRDFGYKVGILDVDLCGPSIPHLLNLEKKEVFQCAEGWMPVYVDKEQSLCAMSIGFLLNSSEEAVVWRGPKKNAMIKQFLSDVNWPSDMDFLVVDMPPGTSDEHMAVVENLKNAQNTHAVLVTTPQLVAINDVRREITFCMKTGLPIIGMIENMSGFTCPNCKECTAMFSRGGAESLANEMSINLLGSIPLDPVFSTSIQKRCERETIESDTLQKFNTIAKTIVESIK